MVLKIYISEPVLGSGVMVELVRSLVDHSTLFLRVSTQPAVYNSNTFKGDIMKRGTRVMIVQHEVQTLVGLEGVVTAAHCMSGSIRYHIETIAGTYYCSVSQLKISNQIACK
tara:strand:+ start:404 stop:739 length:336 start_codon:yes stop_codon:yes gene_type:complete